MDEGRSEGGTREVGSEEEEVRQRVREGGWVSVKGCEGASERASH